MSCVRKRALIIRAMLAGARKKFFRSLRVDISLCHFGSGALICECQQAKIVVSFDCTFATKKNILATTS